MRKIGAKESKRDYMIYSDTLDQKYKPDMFLLKMSIGVIAMILSVLIDITVLTDFIRANRIHVGFNSEGISGLGAIGGFIFVFDLLLPFAFIALKRRYCRVDMAPWVLIYTGFAVIAVFLACILLIRLSLVIPDDVARGSTTYEQAYIFALLPLATSVTCSIIFWITYNPILIKMRETEQLIFSESEKLMSVQSELEKYESDEGDYLTRLVEEEDRRYQHKMQEIKSIEVDLKAYFRRKLAETLAEPDSASILSAVEFTPYVEPVKLIEIPQSMLQIISEKGEKSA